MAELMNALSDPASMTQAQWLVLAIAAFIVLGSLYFMLKLFKLVKNLGKTDYKPNIGRSRVGFGHQTGDYSDETKQE